MPFLHDKPETGLAPAKKPASAILCHALAIAGLLGAVVIFFIVTLSGPDSGLSLWMVAPPIVGMLFFWIVGDLIDRR